MMFEFLLLALLACIAYVLLRPLAMVGEGLNPVNLGNAPKAVEQAMNYSGATIPHGTVVARYAAASEDTAEETARKNCLGIIAPTRNNCELLGILNAPDKRRVLDKMAGLLSRGGLCQAKVRVPASTNLAAGTLLVPATFWDAANNYTEFGTSAAAANPGVLEPLIWAGAIVAPANPFAILKQALTATASDTIQMAWVDVDRFHKPLPFARTIALPDATFALSDLILQRCLGPGIVTGVVVQLLTGGTTSGSTTLDCAIVPIQAASGDEQSIFSTPITFPHDAGDGDVFGAGASKDGVTGDFTLGTGGAQGTLKAENLRVFPALALLKLDLATTATAAADLIATVEGKYL